MCFMTCSQHSWTMQVICTSQSQSQNCIRRTRSQQAIQMSGQYLVAFIELCKLRWTGCSWKDCWRRQYLELSEDHGHYGRLSPSPNCNWVCTQLFLTYTLCFFPHESKHTKMLQKLAHPVTELFWSSTKRDPQNTNIDIRLCPPNTCSLYILSLPSSAFGKSRKEQQKYIVVDRLYLWHFQLGLLHMKSQNMGNTIFSSKRQTTHVFLSIMVLRYGRM